jgi:hypothetical protein
MGPSHIQDFWRAHGATPNGCLEPVDLLDSCFRARGSRCEFRAPLPHSGEEGGRRTHNVKGGKEDPKKTALDKGLLMDVNLARLERGQPIGG